MEFKPYHKIKQFRNIVRDISFKANFKGLDPQGQPIYEETRKPVLTFTATTKLHGTNAGICYTPEKGLRAQKRSSFLSTENFSGHFGFNQFVLVEKRQYFESLMKILYSEYCAEGEQITLYGEWAGAGIQKSVGISEISKSFYIFDCKVYNPETDEFKWINVKDIEIDDPKIHNIYDFSTWQLDIDFNDPGLSQNKLVEITNAIEKECPVSKKLGIKDGTGEGAVWVCFWEGEKYIFKVKGEKHSVSKVKKLATVDTEVLKSINDFVEYACTENRVNQGIQEVNAKDKKDTSSLLKWVANDIIKEETDVLIANGLEWKQVAGKCSSKIREIFFSKLNEF